jgi:hypothetical protein
MIDGIVTLRKIVRIGSSRKASPAPLLFAQYHERSTAAHIRVTQFHPQQLNGDKSSLLMQSKVPDASKAFRFLQKITRSIPSTKWTVMGNFSRIKWFSQSRLWF